MASFGEALEALEEFRAELVNQQMNAPLPAVQAMAFRALAGAAGAAPLANVHATGVGIRDDGQFVIKVYMFSRSATRSAAAVPLLNTPLQGVAVDVETLPVQTAFAQRPSRQAAPRTPRRLAAPIGSPAAHQARRRPVPGGVEIGPLGGNYAGTLGCFVRGIGAHDGPLFVLSNNHVLADVNRFLVGRPFTQPFSADPADVIATLSDFEPIAFPAPGSQPRNVIDAAIAVVTDTRRVVVGKILGIRRYEPRLLAPRPGMRVVKAGRTTGVTHGMIRAIRMRGVQVNYGTRQQPIIATFDNAITLVGDDGAPFSNPGDSGSVILDAGSGRPVALLFAGDDSTTTACDLAATCARFNVRPV